MTRLRHVVNEDGVLGEGRPTAEATTAWFECGVDRSLVWVGDNHIDVRLAITRALAQSVSLDRVELAVNSR